MRLIDKLIIAGTGIGAVALAVDYVRKHGEPEVDNYPCPYCRKAYATTYVEFAKHIAQHRRGY